MVERFLTQTSFTSVEDFKEHLHFIIKENFNFAYDVMDEWAATYLDKTALLWTNDEGMEIRLSFSDLKARSDQAAAYLASLGISRGDMVMLILKRRLEWWVVMLALCKLSDIAIPATHMLKKKEKEYFYTKK